MKKICFVIVYFGSLRNDFYFWLKSVQHNPSVDFLFVTDQDVINPPCNLKIIKSNLKEVETIAREKIWNGCIIEHPHKLCDYKVAYGEMFSEYLHDYDFWGYCDTDLVFGDIRKYITDEMLSNYDRIGLEGPFSLYRNTPKITNSFWELGTDHVHQVFTEQHLFAIDEWGLSQNGTSNYWLKYKKDKVWYEMVFDNIEPYYYDLLSAKVIRYDKGLQKVIFSFEKGRLWRYGLKDKVVAKSESLFVHLQRRDIRVSTSVDDKFSMVPPGEFISYAENVTPSYLKWHVKNGVAGAYYTRLRNKINKYLGLKQYGKTVLIYKS